MPKFESEIQITSVKNASTSNGGIQFSDSSNTLVMHIGDDNRVGIGTDAPETTLHVDGAIKATGLIVPPGVLSSATDTADFWGFNPIFDDWYANASEQLVANGYIQTGAGLVTQSTESVLGSYSALFPRGSDAVWSRKVIFAEPLYANVFIQGHYSYKFAGTHSAGEPGFAIRLKHRAVGDDGDSYSNTFIAPTFPAHSTASWQTVNFRAVTPPNREIQELEISLVHTAASDDYNTTSAGVELSGGGGATQTALGGGTDYDWYVDGLGFNFMHPDMRIDQEGRITGSYIGFAQISDAHIKNYIASSSSRIYDNPPGDPKGTALPSWHVNYPTSGTDGTSKLSDALVANSSYAKGWSIDKEGDIKATGLTIYSDTGRVLIKGGSQNPFQNWIDGDTPPSLSYLDPEASTYLYGLSFEESNRTDLRANIQFLATSGLSNNVVANAWSMYVANTVTGPPGDKGGLLANSTIVFNGITVDAPPGSIFTGGKGLVRNQDAYIMFLANTEKWDSDVGNSQYYHANSYLGEHGLYVLGTPTVGGWLYHPHANDTWYSIDSEQSGNRLHENDFLVIGKIATDNDSKIRRDKTFLQPPKHPDSITASESLGTQSPIGITAGGILFADILLNQWEHTANAGEVQLTNQRNSPNTRFTFIHPGTADPNDSKVYTVNGAYGVLTSLEGFPGSRYITFVGADPGRFTLQTGHSPDFVAAFPLNNKWYYNQDEGAFSIFTPSAKDCIVARVDANGSVGQLTNVYRYAEREATTEEGASISDLIVDPPRGMSSGGFVFGEFKLNQEFDSSTNTFKANAGFVSITNVENTPQNELYVIHPDNGNSFYVDSIGRGVVTSLKPTGDVYGTRHIAFVGQDQTRFDLPSAGYENVANDFVAVLRYDSDGNPLANGSWFYDDGDTTTKIFTPDANDFIVATLSSYNPNIDGVDQLTRWSAREAEVFIDGVATTITSMKVLLDGRIDTANNTAQTAIDLANEAYANAVAAASNAYAALGLLDGKFAIYYEVEGADGGVFKDLGEDDTRFDFNDLWINTSTYNKFLDDSWSSNAIFKYANAALGFEGDLKWRPDENHAGGRAAISGLSAREFADRATVIFYEERSAAAYPFYGPNVAVISTGSTTYLNKNPEGDLWYDIKPLAGDSAPANQPYVYRTNATFIASNTTHTGFITTGTGAWAQTVHNTATSGVFDRDTAQTGWWSLQDSSAGDAAGAIAAEAAARLAADNLEINLRTWGVGNALSAAETAQAAADREILAFFVDSTADAPASTGNGDIWIHTDNAIDSTGTMNAKSIFIANTNSPGSYGAGSVNPPERFWNESPNSAIGLMFLEGYIATYAVNSIAYTAMATGNGKIVAHFGPHWPLDTGTHGPLPSTTPSGLENAEPHGDFWINTSNNNLAFVYHQNTLVNFAQTAYYTVLPENNYAGGLEPLSGWYSTEDMRTANALTTSHTALSDAASAQASADREIIAFFQNNVPTATGNGDIWIDTDKSSPLTALAIYVAFSEGATTIGGPSTGNWYQSSSSAVGQVYLNAYLAGETASRTESLIMNSLGTSDLPFPLWDKVNDPDNVANGIMGVGATGNVVFYKNRLQSSAQENPGEIFVENYGSVDFIGPTGKVWYPNSSDVDFGIQGGDTTIRTPYEDPEGSLTIDTNISVAGNPWRHDGGAANVAYLMYSNQNVISRFESTDVGNRWGNNHHFAVVFWDSVLNTWSLRNDNTSGEPDPIRFIPDSANGDFLVAQIERKYVESPEVAENRIGIHRLESWVFDTLPSQIKGLTDGKIVTHFESHYPTSGPDKGKYGPWAQTTPTGLSNPDPHGDFWIDTANNNLVFRYHQNTINRTARSVYHANNIQHKADFDESGWYSTEDLRTSNALETSYSALQAARTAQAAADKEILAFFANENSPPNGSTGNGDVWIVTDYAVVPGTGAANTTSIRVANTLNTIIPADLGPIRGWHVSPDNGIGLSYLQSYADNISGEFDGGGENLMPRPYSMFTEKHYDYNHYNKGLDYSGGITVPTTYTIPGHNEYPGAPYGFRTWQAYPHTTNASFGYGSSGSLQKTTNSVFNYRYAPSGSGGSGDTYDHTYFSGPKGPTWFGSSFWTDPYNYIKIPKGKKWIYSLYVNVDTPTNMLLGGADEQVQGSFDVVMRNSANAVTNSAYIQLPMDSVEDDITLQTGSGGWVGFSPAASGDGWERISGVLDLTTTDSTGFNHQNKDSWKAGLQAAGFVGNSAQGYGPSIPLARNEVDEIRFHFNYGYNLVSNTISYSAIQFEEVPANRNKPTPFMEPGTAATLNFARSIADGKIVEFHVDGTGNPLQGPVPNPTPQGLPNPTPYGDKWFDTANNNTEFWYFANATHKEETSVYWTSGPSSETTGESGWYSLEDARIANAFSTSHSAQARADDAYSSAAVAQAAADKEILAFFALLSNIPAASGNGDIWVVTDYPVNLNGTPNVASLYISNTLSTSPPAIQDSVTATQYWNPAPYNAIGLSYLESFASGVSGAYQRGDNIMPRAYSLFDQPLNDYEFNKDINGAFVARPATDITQTQLPYPIAVSSASIWSSAPGGAFPGEQGRSIVHVQGECQNIRLFVDEFGDHYLSSNNGTSGGLTGCTHVIFANTHISLNDNHPTKSTFDKSGIVIPAGKRWILSFEYRTFDTTQTSSPAGPLNTRLYGANSTFYGGYIGHDVEIGVTTDDSPWERVHKVFDFTSGSVFGANTIVTNMPTASKDLPVNEWNRVFLGFEFKTDNARYHHIKKIQLEEVESHVSSPSTFREPSSATSIVFGRQITDGKILTRYETHYPDDDSGTHWGPDPSVTPKDGLPNPEPHGDSWHNTSNNNLIFRYHQNSINNSAQTIFYPAYGASIAVEADSGWYSTEDPRTANSLTNAYQALSDAATAQAAADREIQSFFVPHYTTATASGNGDVWIHTDNVLDIEGNVNTNAVFVWNDAVSEWQQRPESGIGRGFLKTFTESSSRNWVPSVLSTWAAPLSDYDFTDKHQTAAATAKKVTVVDKPITMWTSIISPPGWPAGSADMSAEINEATASAGNTARVEVIEDFNTGDTGNSYVSGRALHIKNGRVTSAGVDTEVSYIGIFTANGPLSGTGANYAPRWDSPYVINVPKNRQWVVSWYEKAWKSGDAAGNLRGSIAVKKSKNADGTNNGWMGMIGGNPTGDLGQYTTLFDRKLYETSGTRTQDTENGVWYRRSTFLDLTSANQVFGYGGPYRTSLTQAIESNFTDDMDGWESSSSDLSIDSGWLRVKQKTGVTGPDSVSNAFSVMGRTLFTTGETVSSFSGMKYHSVTVRASANSFLPHGASRPYPFGMNGWDRDNIFREPLPESNPGALPLLKWSTVEDDTMGGTGGTQTCQCWTGGPGTSSTSDTEPGSSMSWRVHNIPTWRERNITGIELQLYNSLSPGDQYDIEFIRIGQTPQPVANEIDQMAFYWLSNEISEAYVDGIQLEEVTGTGRRTPGPFNDPSDKVSSDFSRAIADGKIITHYENNSGNPNWRGPNPHLTPKDGLVNLTPYGDLWVDTANNNIIYRYYQNTTNYTSNSVYHAIPGGVSPADHNDESGWYSTEDLRAQTAFAATEVLAANVQQALASAASAASAADAELLVFFQPSTNTYMHDERFSYGSYTGPATGNGDIWIHTDFATNQDGTPNNYAIYFANLSTGAVAAGTTRIANSLSPLNYTGWTQSPDNAIGRGFIEQFASVGVKNWMHSGYSLFDEDPEEYELASGVNSVTQKPYPITVNYVNMSLTINNTSGYIGSNSLRLNLPTGGTSAYQYISFANNNSTPDAGTFEKYGIRIPPGKKWIYSAWFQNPEEPSGHRLAYYTQAGTVIVPDDGDVVGTYPRSVNFFTLTDFDSDSVLGDWVRCYRTIDLTNSEANNIILAIGAFASGKRVTLIDGIQLEEAPGVRIQPGQFSDPDRQISDDFARALSDGKILTHYEPAIDNLKAWWRMDSANTSGWIANEVNPGTMDIEHEGAHGIANVAFSSDTIFGSGNSLVMRDSRDYWEELGQPPAGSPGANGAPYGRGATLITNDDAATLGKSTYTFWVKPTGRQNISTIDDETYVGQRGSAHQWLGRQATTFWSMGAWRANATAQHMPSAAWLSSSDGTSDGGPDFNQYGDGATYLPVTLWTKRDGTESRDKWIGDESTPGIISVEQALLMNRWNFVAVTVDYKDNLPGTSGKTLSVFCYNEQDGFSNSATVGINAYATSTTTVANSGAEGFGDRPVILGAAGSTSPLNTSSADARFNHIRLYDKILSKPDIEALFNTRTRTRKQPDAELYPYWYSNNVVYGPDPEFTPQKRLPNPAPHGDYWYDSSDFNRPFRYNQNTSNKVAQTAYYSTIAYQEDKLGYEPSGWFTSGDGTAEISADSIGDVGRDVAESLERIRQLNPLIDHELKIFFETEGTTHFGNALGTHTTAAYGDIWINTSDYNANGYTGGLVSNAIFRWQNSLGFSTKYSGTEASTGATLGMAWRHAEDNAFGQIYLSASYASNAADRLVAVYSGSGTAEASVWYGPNVAFTMTGIRNPNPDGDLWYDTGNNNIAHVFNKVGGTWPEFAQTVHSDASSMVSEGWYILEDLRTASADLAREIALATGTDRHAQIFTSTTAPTTSTGNGDIWVDTSDILNFDGTANYDAIYIANTKDPTSIPANDGRGWTVEPSSGLGRSQIERLMGESGRNWVPAPLSLWNSPSVDYQILHAEPDWHTDPLPPAPLHRFHSYLPLRTPRPHTYYNTSGGLSSTDGIAGVGNTARIEIISDTNVGPTGNSYISGKAFRTYAGNTIDSDGNSHEADYLAGWFANSTADQLSAWGSPTVIDIPRGRDWILSYYTKAHNQPDAISPGLKRAGELRVYAKKKYDDDGSANTWLTSRQTGLGFDTQPYPTQGEWVRRHSFLNFSRDGQEGGRYGTNYYIKEGSQVYDGVFEGADGGFATVGATVDITNPEYVEYIAEADGVRPTHTLDSVDFAPFAGVDGGYVSANVQSVVDHNLPNQSILFGQIAWKTTVDTTMGGADDKQTAVRWSGNAPGGGAWTKVYFDMSSNDEWNDRTITEVQFTPYYSLDTGDKYRVANVTIGASTVPERKEIDALMLQYVIHYGKQDVFWDGFQLEDVTGTDRRTPGPFQSPDAAGQIDFSRAIADGKTVYFVSNTFHGATENHAYGPNPSISDNGLVNPEPYGDKWISLSPPYKTYLYFSNASNKTAQTAFHTPTTYALGNYKNTQWPFGTTNNTSGWYEYRDTGDALTQEGLQVKLHSDSINQVAIGESVWTEGGLSVLLERIRLLEDDINNQTSPTLDLGDITSFGQTRELFLNSVPPRDANLMGHWTFNSFGVDDNGVKYLPDATGRNNHARVVGYTANQAAFSDHSPAKGFVNVSGNLSVNNSVGSKETVPTNDDDGHIVIAQHGEDNATDLQIGGQPYPALRIDDTATFNKGTFCFWVKPGTPVVDVPGSNWNTFFGRHYDSWGQLRTTTFNGWNANNEFSLDWYYPNAAGGRSTQLIDINADGWVHPPVNNISKALKYNEWHFIVWQWDFDSSAPGEKYTRMWIYRDGAGLLYTALKPAPDAMTASVDGNSFAGASSGEALCLGASTNSKLGTGTLNNHRGVGNYDEARLYSEVLSARNLRFLFENPSGRPFAAPNRPGIGVRKGYASFFVRQPPVVDGSDSVVGVFTNSTAYFHGFDVDGNPADVDPYISFNGNVKYLKKSQLRIGIKNGSEVEARKYQGNTGYVMYNDTAYVHQPSVPAGAGRVLISDDTNPCNYVFAMPVGANSTQPYTWRYQEFFDGNNPVIGWKYFTPDDNKDLIVGEMRLANASETGLVSSRDEYLQIETIEAYQMARKPSVVRESYNFNITPADFTDNFQGGTHFFANAAFWNSSEGIESTFILSLVAEKIQTGTLTAGVTVGAEAKVTIDGTNSRIVIKD